MQTTWHDALHSLQAGEALRIHGGTGTTVIVFGGQVWLTQDGDLRDLFLGAGDSFTLDASAPALMQAVKPAQVMLAGPLPAAVATGPSTGPWQRLRSGLARTLGAQRLHVEHWPAPQRALA